MIQSQYRGYQARQQVQEVRKQHAAATKIQAVHRGRMVRRDMDFRSSFTMRKDGMLLRKDLDDIGVRMREMSKAMEEKIGKTRWYETSALLEKTGKAEFKRRKNSDIYVNLDF